MSGRQFAPCHTLTSLQNTTDAYRHACGSCGGDKRSPVTPAPVCHVPGYAVTFGRAVGR